MIADAAQRQRALEPTRSFCVTAPAGSGKTELLIQRYLGLLARVNRPEQVLAITFTRKAAAEMRERVLQALGAALEGRAPENPHQQLTRQLAQRALAADSAGDWQLTCNISRLQIQTIDSFCAGLTRHMPVLSEFGGQARITDDAQALYREAVAELFGVLEGDQPPAADLKALLRAFDNDWQRVRNLLVGLLQRRDQWGEYAGLHQRPALAQALLRRTVHTLVAEELQELAPQLTDLAPEILALQQYAAGQLGEPPPDRFPAPEAGDLEAWRRVQRLLLTTGGQWRKKVDRRNGFPTGSETAREFKQRFAAVRDALAERDGLLQRLQALSALPVTDAGDIGWRLALSVSALLPRLAAELLLVFSRRGEVDHSQVALSALQALGEEEAPTDLALRLDYRIEHILVDEFQDTAIGQYRLVQRLTHDWASYNAANPGAPRTIMIVGDGMQSIYGFRDANVGLFLKAQAEGFNGVPLEDVQLLCNFRSLPPLVNWVNQTFAQAFPRRDDSRRGLVRFTPATAVREADGAGVVTLRGFTGEASAQAEIAMICREVRRELETGEAGSIAILGRSRNQLQPLLAALRGQGIGYSAQEMDSLAQSPVAADLFTLCRALANPSDRVAWLALLRGPWCGLRLADMHRLVLRAGNRPLCRALAEPDLLEDLGADARRRAAHLARALERAESRRDRLALRVWLEQLWINLRGPAAVSDAGQLQDAEQFLQLLEAAEQAGRGLDLAWLKQRLVGVKTSAGDPDSRLQVMTLHRAKGLEFDRVFIPDLGARTRGDERGLMLWDDYTSRAGERGFLLAADDRSEPGAPTLYNFLRRQRKLKSRQENARLLYVGATRAVRRLDLSARVSLDQRSGEWKPPPADSLMWPIWEVFSRQMQVLEGAATTAGAARSEPGLLRLAAVPDAQPDPRSRRLPAAGRLEGVPPTSRPLSSPGALNREQRHLGTMVHRALEELSLRRTLPREISAADWSRWRISLRDLGLSGVLLESACARLERCLRRTLDDPVGRWLLAGNHIRARSEWAITWRDDEGRPRDLVVDRCFIDRDSGECWLVDYKTGEPAAGQALETFLNAQLEQYREQLQCYQQATQALEDRPVRCALYFPALGTLAELPQPV